MPWSLIEPANYTVNLYAIPMLVATVALFSLGVAVLAHERGTRVSLLFFVIALTICQWLFAFSFMYCAIDESVALMWAKIAYLGVPLIPSVIYHFTVEVLHLGRSHSVSVRVSWLLSILSVVAIVGTDSLIGGLYRHWWGYYPQYGRLGIPYLAFFFTMLVLSLRLFWIEYRKAIPGTTHWRRVRNLLLAFCMVYLVSFDYLAMYGVSLYPFGYIPVLIFFALAGRTIWRYHLVDITPSFAADQIIQTMTEALFVLDREGIIQIANPQACRMFNMPVETLVGRPITQIDPSLLPAEQLEMLLRHGLMSEHEATFQEPDGQELLLSCSASLMRDQTKQPVAIVYIARDMSERKHVEQTLHMVNKQLAKLAIIVESSQDAIISKTLEGAIMSWNKGAERLYGYPAKEAIGRHISMIIPKDKQSEFESILNRLRHNEGVESYETVRIRKDGRPLDVSLTLSAIRDPSGHVVGAASIARDISDRKRAEQRLKQMNRLLVNRQMELSTALKQLQETNWQLREAQLQLIQAAKLESLGRLAAGVAHEVKNPLATLLIGIDELLDHIVLDEHLKQLLQDMRYAIKRADAVIRGMLDFSAPKRLELIAQPITSVMEQALSLVKHELDRNHVIVIKEMADPIPKLMFDRSKMEQVFVNVFMNAVQAMPEGGTLRITLGTKRLDENDKGVGRRAAELFKAGDTIVVVDIKDSGPGIPPDKLSKIFDPFFTTKPPGKGTGLGLTVSKAIVEMHRGIITVANHPEGGVQVTLWFKADARIQPEDAMMTITPIRAMGQQQEKEVYHG